MRKKYSTPEVEFVKIRLCDDVLSASVTEPFTPEETIGEQIFDDEP